MIAVILLSSPFIIQLTSSAKYDPWADLDGDGDVDIFDIVDIATRYDTKGDATREVNVVSLPVHTTVVVAEDQYVQGSFWSPSYNASGFGKLKLMISYYGGDVQGEVELKIYGYVHGYSTIEKFVVYTYPMTGNGYQACLNYPMPCERFQFRFNTVIPNDIYLDLSFYMTWA